MNHHTENTTDRTPHTEDLRGYTINNTQIHDTTTPNREYKTMNKTHRRLTNQE